MSKKRTLLTSLLLLPLVHLTLLSSAHAEKPIDVTGQITDEAGVLGAEQAEVRQALDRFFDRTGLQLFVVYVPTFDDITGEEWAARTSEKSGLGKGDVLLAVATKDRAYGYDADEETFTEDELQEVDRTRILPQLREDDYAGAAIEAADGFGDAAEDEFPVGLVALIGILVLLVGAVVVRRIRRRFDHTHRVLDEHGNPVDPAAILTTEELDSTASRALVAIDDALKTSEQELGFAEAQFGSDETARFRATLQHGRELVREAFTLRQQLDDSVEESEKERRAMASRIITICEQVDDELDAEVESFDRLRDLQANAPTVLQELGPRADAVVGRLADSRATLAALGDQTGVSGNPDQAERLIASAREQVDLGKAEDDSATAATHARAAEDALAQATILLDAIDEAKEREAKAAQDRASLEDELGRVSSLVKGVSEFVETRRGAVGAEARTRLSEAARHLEIASRSLASDPDATRTALEHSERQAAEAQRLADRDVEAWDRREDDGDDRRGTNLDSMILGGILVDALGRRDKLGSVLGGSSHGGGSGTPYGGTSRSGSSRTPGSFGGTRTRGRRRGGGRF